MVQAGATSAAESYSYGAGMCTTTAGVGTTFRVQAVDAYGNLKTDTNDVFSYAINGKLVQV